MKHKRQITEKELKIAAKQINLQVGLIEYLIAKVRENQSVSETKHCECDFAMIQRDQETQKAYCFECKKEINE